MPFLTNLLTVIIALAPYFVPPLIAGLALVTKNAMDKLPITSRPVVAQAVATAVAATEQVASNALNGPGKKQIALDMIDKELTHLGIRVPASVISNMIEEAVLALPQVAGALTPVMPPVPEATLCSPIAPNAG